MSKRNKQHEWDMMAHDDNHDHDDGDQIKLSQFRDVKTNKLDHDFCTSTSST